MTRCKHLRQRLGASYRVLDIYKVVTPRTCTDCGRKLRDMVAEDLEGTIRWTGDRRINLSTKKGFYDPI